jgi:hypothetical protein
MVAGVTLGSRASRNDTITSKAATQMTVLVETGATGGLDEGSPAV